MMQTMVVHRLLNATAARHCTGAGDRDEVHAHEERCNVGWHWQTSTCWPLRCAQTAPGKLVLAGAGWYLHLAQTLGCSLGNEQCHPATRGPDSG